MPLIHQGKKLFIRRISLDAPLRGSVIVEEGNGNAVATYNIAFTGNGNFIADAYELISGLPEFSGAALDRSDIAADFPGSGGAELLITGRTLAEIKDEARQRINRARDIEEAAGFYAFGKFFDSDAVSLQRIALAVAAAKEIGDMFSIVWTCADNSSVTLNYAQITDLPVVIAQAGNALHVKSRQLKEQIDAATTLEQIEAISW